MRWGKQGYELGTLFVDANPTRYLIGKLVGPTSALLEYAVGRNLAMDWEMPFNKDSHIKRLFMGGDRFSKSAIANLFTKSFLPFSLAGHLTSPVPSQAGFLTALGPVTKGPNKAVIMGRMEERMKGWAKHGPRSAVTRQEPLWKLLSDLIREADLNGYNGLDLANSSLGAAAMDFYQQAYENLPGNPSSNVDLIKAGDALDALARLGRGMDRVSASMKGRDATRGIRHSRDTWMLRREGYDRASDITRRRDKWEYWETRQAAKGGDVSGILGTDEVPDTILGYKVEMPENLKDDEKNFFSENPEAAGVFDYDHGERPGNSFKSSSSATDYLKSSEVPDSILGYRIVPQEEFTEGDIKYFQEYPAAAGFFEPEDEQQPQGDQ